MSASTVWLVIVLCTAVTFAIKGAGPAAMSDRELPRPVAGVVLLLAPALLTAQVVTTALADGRTLHAGADTAGVAVGAVLLWRRVPLLAAVVAAVAVTAGLRAAGLS